jgi:putative addiction module component (TIGR02574 family)
MASSLKALGLDRLSVDERIRLVEDLWDDIASAVESREIPESHKRLLDQRIAAYQADPTAGLSWEEVKTLTRTITGEVG